jgi:tRNA(Ile)-lysidine synthase TilS/MesJ
MRKMNFAENAVRRFADQLKNAGVFRPGLGVGPGVSCGADSVALLALLKIRAELGVVASALQSQVARENVDADARSSLRCR